ncbi:hypothetical protein [Roseateles sp.]|uniref:hypothetical protein n=1 Tax=Roseateles sp. TaxID=1971397 RepID=UPI0039EA5FED
MDIAFGALVLALCLAPALTFRAALRSGTDGSSSPEAVEPTFLTLGEELRWLLPLSLTIHLVAIAVSDQLGYSIDWVSFLSLLTGNDDLVKSAIPKLADSVSLAATYAVATVCGSHALGSTARFIVRRTQLHRRFGWFEYRSRWTYLLRAETPTVSTSPQPDYLVLELFMSGSDEPRRYRGVLDSFWLDASGELTAVGLNIPMLNGSVDSAHEFAIIDCRQAEVAVIQGMKIEPLASTLDPVAHELEEPPLNPSPPPAASQ